MAEIESADAARNLVERIRQGGGLWVRGEVRVGN